jgi:N6-L-threonylcarbamoyladenine synthase
VALLVSGGHSSLLLVTDVAAEVVPLGATIDDAAGEAYDKVARLLGLPFPGGPPIDAAARDADGSAVAFPRGKYRDGTLDFSFAGLKTALLYRIRELGEAEAERRRADLAASYQRAIVEALILRVERALAQTRMSRLAIGGGVAANGPLRERVEQLGVEIDIPPRALCTDNAAMIASAARYVAALPYPEYLSLDAYPSGARAPAPAPVR